MLDATRDTFLADGALGNTDARNAFVRHAIHDAVSGLRQKKLAARASSAPEQAKGGVVLDFTDAAAAKPPARFAHLLPVEAMLKPP